jgi:hypothetical protein
MIYKFGFLILAIAASTFTDAIIDEMELKKCVETADCDVCALMGDAVCAENAACVKMEGFPWYSCKCNDGYKKAAMGMCVLEGSAIPGGTGDACTPNHCTADSTCQATVDGFPECLCSDGSGVVRPKYPCPAPAVRNLRAD